MLMETRYRLNKTDDEIGILIFNIDRYRLGINLGKVREITASTSLKPVPYAHPLIEGVFELRNRLVPVINLRKWLRLEQEHKITGSSKIIITEFLGLRVGFLVDNIEKIHRTGWQNVSPPEAIKRFTPDILGILKIDDCLINLIDYEKIVLSINPDAIIPESQRKKDSKKLVEKRKSRAIWIIDDSNTIRDFLRHHLSDSGYTNLIFFENGKHALETLAVLEKKKQLKGDQTERVDIIISDIEMPEIDGYTLAKTIKSDQLLKTIPVILFSSLLSSDNKLKGEVVEADAQLSKSDSINLVNLIDRFIFT
jgi:two-component system, chemotaxis family, chemotaxis protein CheV